MATVDVIIPLYNKQATIERAIRSVQSQTFADWRLLMVDDGSTDGGAEIVRRMQKEDKRIELIVQANAGPGAARNAGIRTATAAYLAFLDADDQWYPSHLETALNAIRNHPAAPAGTMHYERPIIEPEKAARKMPSYCWHCTRRLKTLDFFMFVSVAK